MENLAGIFLALIAAAVLLALAQGGWAGVGDLLRAKFLGKPKV